MLVRNILILFFIEILVGCATLDHPPPGLKDIKRPKAVLDLLSISPSPSLFGVLDRKSVIYARLKYEIDEFEISKFGIIAQFDKTTRNVTFDGDFPKKLYPIIEQERGEIIYRFPVRYIWDQKDLARPIRGRFYLVYRISKGSVVIAETEEFTYLN